MNLRPVCFLLLLWLALQSAAYCQATPPNAPVPIAFGTLETDSAHAKEEYAGGVRVAMMEIFWDRYERSDGQFNADYAAAQRRRLEHLKAIGFQVTLALGTYDPPHWLAREPNATFIDQNRNASKDLNFVFNEKMRAYFQRYLERVNKDLGFKNFWAIRITSGSNAELLYPGGGTYWAFDANAQNGPDRPSDLPRCPYPGWKPGQDTLTPTQVREWADWYVHCLALTAQWQMHTINALGFTGWYQILTPGSGARPSTYDAAINHHLPNGIVGVGAVWHRVYEFLSKEPRLVVYVSSVADHSGNDDATQPEDANVALSDPVADTWSATRWQARIAREYNLPIGGENPGYNAPPSLNAHYVDPSPAGMLARSLAQAKAAHFQCFYWAHSERLWDDTMPFARYAVGMLAVNGGSNPSAPWP